jgi:F0F1-type ATP synthase assembly protein I
MLKDTTAQIYLKVFFLQALSILVLAGAAFFAIGEMGFVSAIAGGGTVLMGNLVYSVVASASSSRPVSGKRLLARHALAEAAKVAVVLALTMAALATGWFVGGWLVAAMGIALIGHWLALLIIR